MMNVARTELTRQDNAWLAGSLSILFAMVAGSAQAASGAKATINFNRDIRPVLVENCFACHGPDNNARKAGLRMDTKEGIFEKTKKHEPAMVPGSLEKSEL